MNASALTYNAAPTPKAIAMVRGAMVWSIWPTTVSMGAEAAEPMLKYHAAVKTANATTKTSLSIRYGFVGRLDPIFSADRRSRLTAGLSTKNNRSQATLT